MAPRTCSAGGDEVRRSQLRTAKLVGATCTASGDPSA
jgi:hypothetical protein